MDCDKNCDTGCATDSPQRRLFPGRSRHHCQAQLHLSLPHSNSQLTFQFAKEIIVKVCWWLVTVMVKVYPAGFGQYFSVFTSPPHYKLVLAVFLKYGQLNFSKTPNSISASISRPERPKDIQLDAILPIAQGQHWFPICIILHLMH